jgi:hypothetical protein
MKRLIALGIFTAMTLTPVFAEELAMTDEQAAKLVKIQETPIILHSHLKKKYSGYRVTIESEYPGKLEVKQSSIDNGVVGGVAADSTTTSYANVLWGLPLVWLGMGIAALVISNKNHKAETESYQFPNQIPNNTLHRNDVLTFTALVPNGQTPQIKLRFEDEKTGLAFAKTGN